MLVLRPNFSIKWPGGSKNDAVGHWQSLVNACFCCGYGNCCSQFSDGALLHVGLRSDCRIFAFFPEQNFKNFIHHYSGNKQSFHILKRRYEFFRISCVCKKSKPCRRIDKIHMRSSDRSTLVSIPLTNPRRREKGKTGTSSIRLPYSTTWTFCPGCRWRDLRTVRGMTTWYLGDIFTASISASIDGVLVLQIYHRYGC